MDDLRLGTALRSVRVRKRLRQIDVGARAGIFDIVSKLADTGLAIILISDEVPEVYYNADRVLHMVQGRIAGEYIPSATKMETIEEAVYA